MRYLIIVKATKESEAGVMPEEKLIVEIPAYHEDLAKAGMLIDGIGAPVEFAGLAHPVYFGEKRTFVDGPLAETKELVAGYTLIQVKSRKEALEWTKRYPNPAGNGKQGESRLPIVRAGGLRTQSGGRAHA